MAGWLHYLKKIAMLILLFPLRIFTIKKERVVLHNDLAQKYSGNPKAVAEFLRKSYSGTFQIVYSVRDAEQFPALIEKGLIPVRYKSMRYYYYAMTAHVFLTNSGGYSFLPLRKGQYVINTWHGGGAYKSMGTEMHNHGKLFQKDLRLAVKKTSLFISSCHRFTQAASRDMLYPENIFWEIGMPRNDMLIRQDPELRQRIRQQLGLQPGERMVLYAPTYRKPNDDYFKESIAINYGIDHQRVIQAMEERFGGKWKFAMRLHPLAVNHDVIPQDVMDLSDYEDMQELWLAADAMINDFSSSMWDFMLTGKPGFTYAVDLQHYVETTRVYTPVEKWPFPKSTNNDELVESILNFDEEKYREDCKRHYEALGGCETGHACEQVCKRIAEVCGVEAKI